VVEMHARDEGELLPVTPVLADENELGSAQARESSVVRKPRSASRQAFDIGVSLAVVALVFFELFPHLADYEEVWAVISDLDTAELTVFGILGVWNIATYWFVNMAAFSGLNFRQAALSTQSSTAVANTVPGGGAFAVGVTYVMCRSWGLSLSTITRGVLVSGIWNNFAKFAIPVIAVVASALSGDIRFVLFLVALVSLGLLCSTVVLFFLFLRSEETAHRIGDRLGKIMSWIRTKIGMQPVVDWGRAVCDFRDDTVDFLQERWLRLTVTSLVSHFSLFLVLLVTLRLVGLSAGNLSWHRVLLVFAVIRLVSAIPLTPGGIGVVELGYVAILSVGETELTRQQIAAGVLLFRAVTYVLPIFLGLLTWMIWRYFMDGEQSVSGNV